MKESRRINQDMLKQSIKLGDDSLFRFMLDKDSSLADESLGKGLNKPIHIACEYGRLEFVKSLLNEFHVDLNSICPLTGYTPLMYAVQANQYEVVKYLCSLEVEISIKSTYSGRNAVQISSEAEHDRITELLVRTQQQQQ